MASIARQGFCNPPLLLNDSIKMSLVWNHSAAQVQLEHPYTVALDRDEWQALATALSGTLPRAPNC
jgi:hypothetical protein